MNQQPSTAVAGAAPTVWGTELTPSADEQVLDLLRSGIAHRFGRSGEEHYVAPPVIARATVERAGYQSSFPQLLGSVYAAPDGGEQALTDLVLPPAACHHLYPLVAGSTLTEPLTLSLEARCFRAESTGEPGRLRSFRMYEVVRLGPEPDVQAWRDEMLEGAAAWLTDLGLSAETVAANDPFFGRTGRLMARVQRSQQLKWEITAEVADDTVQAVASANFHKEHFGEAFEVADAQGAPLHSACLAFGLDRLLLALRHRHGSDVVERLTRTEAHS
ncbi:hypothetical protein BJF83_16625 [Nocardiopsis sp. CNR-923]|uniref:hypothetical protein n=1 Tax=Nocardiopsis sp. CNR-923 TaxID=1904965 RepID=UPI000966E84C|nr:hypothetical protein [Nocardiopsis sp. CNR-923]OLT27948.1 hypothetical protein BJF83_16625 [Nocardiopsis sp. CNR-923]